MRGSIKALLALSLSIVVLTPARGQRLDGFNVIAAPGHPFGSRSAEQALIATKRLGTTTVAIIPLAMNMVTTSRGARAAVTEGGIEVCALVTAPLARIDNPDLYRNGSCPSTSRNGCGRGGWATLGIASR